MSAQYKGDFFRMGAIAFAEKRKAKTFLTGMVRTEWLWGYYEAQGYERAQNGMISPIEFGEESFAAKCRNQGRNRFLQENQLHLVNLLLPEKYSD